MAGGGGAGRRGGPPGDADAVGEGSVGPISSPGSGFERFERPDHTLHKGSSPVGSGSRFLIVKAQRIEVKEGNVSVPTRRNAVNPQIASEVVHTITTMIDTIPSGVLLVSEPITAYPVLCHVDDKHPAMRHASSHRVNQQRHWVSVFISLGTTRNGLHIAKADSRRIRKATAPLVPSSTTSSTPSARSSGTFVSMAISIRR